METRSESARHIMRHSQSVQEMFNKGKGANVSMNDILTQSRTEKRAPTYFHRLALDSVITRKGSLILLNGPNAIEIQKPKKLSQLVNGAQLNDVYLPAITENTSNLQAARINLSHSCPYVYSSGRRRSTSSVISQRASDFSAKMNYLKEQKELRKSNVLVTMLYLGQGKPGTTQDDMKVLQQKCGGENICVFKGSLQPGEQFQFISQRHLGYPFSATFYVNGIMAGRISSCCEYRYTPGFQQGRKSCFRLIRLSGGKPCYKCVNSRHGIGNERDDIIHHSIHTLKSHEGDMQSCPSSPLFIPAGMERSVQKARKLPKNASKVLTDREDMNDNMIDRKRYKRQKRRYGHRRDSRSSESSQDKKSTRGDQTKSTVLNSLIAPLEKSISVKEKGKEKPKTSKKDKTLDLLQDRETLSKHIGKKKLDPWESNGKSRNGDRLRDFYEECVEMSTGLESGLEQHKWFKANKFERNKLREQLSLGPHPNGSATELEPSEDSDNGALHSKSGKSDINIQEIPKNDGFEKKQELQKKLDAMMEVLNTSDEVELVLRNTGVTDELLMSFVAALKNSLSEVTLINLNLNHIGPPGVHVLLDLLQAKSEIKGLLLFGNHLGDVGVQILISGVADLQEKTASPRMPAYPRQFNLSDPSFILMELDLGGNGIGSEGLRVLGTFIRYHSKLQYLGLAQTCCSSMEAWFVFFESLKVNIKLTQIILDENNLGDEGIKLFAGALQLNESLRKIDLDHNNFGEVGGNALLEALSRSQCSLEHLSLEENYISTALMSKFQEVVKTRDVHTTLKA